MISEPEFQIFQCTNALCRLRFPNNLTQRLMESCPICGAPLTPQGNPFTNLKRLPSETLDFSHSTAKIEVLLENLRSTLNVGSIFRTADGAGVSHVYCCGTTPTPQHPKIEKTSLGAEGFLPWTYRLNALDLVEERKSAGWQIVSIEASTRAASIFSNPLQKGAAPVLLVVGNEVSGIDPAIIDASDQVLYIPMLGKKTSLNVAVAFGIAVYTLIN
jgi:23S rRNA (guanosine2251-2'-O)-methyltransferase